MIMMGETVAVIGAVIPQADGQQEEQILEEMRDVIVAMLMTALAMVTVALNHGLVMDGQIARNSHMVATCPVMMMMEETV